LQQSYTYMVELWDWNAKKVDDKEEEEKEDTEEEENWMQG